ncbi:DUF1211 domain-containing protein [Geomonas nitrogeniifigens]|uniref:DUF1211 domain-containing protein n=1 Tax=Geomonas diazotrophica TaxID=2843197 RepID=A0ABX8JK49_9BACT|nr:TMEM175 family protein [Geomonas nitrogeniifigens]QWV98768.1 DUF1211 domain-containing protein [Geomonas nitrogeniifigens]QXE87925.1 DUF1211 domain-containing protein [Geomonas nitrogeniifigens]
MTESVAGNETGRIEAFSDGVFAIAITLLVLTIKVPTPSDLGAGHSLGSALLALWPHYLAFVTSFVTVLAKWVNHHRIFTFVRTSDHTFLYLNGLVLMLVTFLPFPTALVAEYLLRPEAKVAIGRSKENRNAQAPSRAVAKTFRLARTAQPMPPLVLPRPSP